MLGETETDSLDEATIERPDKERPDKERPDEATVKSIGPIVGSVQLTVAVENNTKWVAHACCIHFDATLGANLVSIIVTVISDNSIEGRVG